MSFFSHWLLKCFTHRFSIVPILVLILVFILATLFFLPSTRKDSTFALTSSTMGTYCRIVIAAPNDRHSRRAADSALAQICALEALTSTYRQESEVSQLSALEPNTPRMLSPEIFTVLERSLYYSRLTDGAFDITVEPLMNLWQAAVKRDRLPSSEEIAGMLRAIGYDKIALDPVARTITFRQAGMSVTLNAIIPGYAADLALARLRQANLPAALVDIGGEIACFGHPPGRNAWDIGIQNPFQPASAPMDTSPGAVLATIRLTDAAVSTSGNYQRFFQIAGRHYSHILDPRTGLPVEQAPSVTVIAPTAADADALATACSVLSVSEALKLINRIPNTEALLITGSAEAPVFHTSTGFAKYLLTPLPD